MRLDDRMADIDDVLARIAADPGYRAMLESEPARALAGLDLDDMALRRIEEEVLGDDVVGFGHGVAVRHLFGSTDAD